MMAVANAQLKQARAEREARAKRDERKRLRAKQRALGDADGAARASADDATDDAAEEPPKQARSFSITRCARLRAARADFRAFSFLASRVRGSARSRVDLGYWRGCSLSWFAVRLGPENPPSSAQAARKSSRPSPPRSRPPLTECAPRASRFRADARARLRWRWRSRRDRASFFSRAHAPPPPPLFRSRALSRAVANRSPCGSSTSRTTTSTVTRRTHSRASSAAACAASRRSGWRTPTSTTSRRGRTRASLLDASPRALLLALRGRDRTPPRENVRFPENVSPAGSRLALLPPPSLVRPRSRPLSR